MNVTDALMSRISTRAFLDRPVPEALVRTLLETARYAPSGGNLQPWHVYVLTGTRLAAFLERDRGPRALPASASATAPNMTSTRPS